MKELKLGFKSKKTIIIKRTLKLQIWGSKTLTKTRLMNPIS